MPTSISLASHLARMIKYFKIIAIHLNYLFYKFTFLSSYIENGYQVFCTITQILKNVKLHMHSHNIIFEKCSDIRNVSTKT